MYGPQAKPSDCLTPLAFTFASRAARADGDGLEATTWLRLSEMRARELLAGATTRNLRIALSRDFK